MGKKKIKQKSRGKKGQAVQEVKVQDEIIVRREERSLDQEILRSKILDRLRSDFTQIIDTLLSLSSHGAFLFVEYLDPNGMPRMIPAILYFISPYVSPYIARKNSQRLICYIKGDTITKKEFFGLRSGSTLFNNVTFAAIFCYNYMVSLSLPGMSSEGIINVREVLYLISITKTIQYGHKLYKDFKECNENEARIKEQIDQLTQDSSIVKNFTSNSEPIFDLTTRRNNNSQQKNTLHLKYFLFLLDMLSTAIINYPNSRNGKFEVMLPYPIEHDIESMRHLLDNLVDIHWGLQRFIDPFTKEPIQFEPPLNPEMMLTQSKYTFTLDLTHIRGKTLDLEGFDPDIHYKKLKQQTLIGKLITSLRKVLNETTSLCELKISQNTLSITVTTPVNLKKLTKRMKYEHEELDRERVKLKRKKESVHNDSKDQPTDCSDNDPSGNVFADKNAHPDFENESKHDHGQKHAQNGSSFFQVPTRAKKQSTPSALTKTIGIVTSRSLPFLPTFLKRSYNSYDAVRAQSDEIRKNMPEVIKDHFDKKDVFFYIRGRISRNCRMVGHIPCNGQKLEEVVDSTMIKFLDGAKIVPSKGQQGFVFDRRTGEYKLKDLGKNLLRVELCKSTYTDSHGQDQRLQYINAEGINISVFTLGEHQNKSEYERQVAARS